MPRKGQTFNGKYSWRMNPLKKSSHTRFGPEYQAWREGVLYRDKYKCMKCGNKKRLKVHHIKRWADIPVLRFAITNGITLCYKCHQEMFLNEEAFEKMCYGLLASATVRMKLGKDLQEMKDQEKEVEDSMDKLVGMILEEE